MIKKMVLDNLSKFELKVYTTGFVMGLLAGVIIGIVLFK